MFLGKIRAFRHLILLFAASCLMALLPGAILAQSFAGGDLIFSHKKHLARAGTTCLACHGSASKSLESSDRNLPREESCLACHDGERAGKDCALCHSEPESVRPWVVRNRTYRFNHRLHVGLGNIAPVLESALATGRYLGDPGEMGRFLKSDNGCLACHRGVLETDFATEGHLPRMADCLVCHTRIDPPFSCEYCHTPEAVLKPASHTLSFADAHSNRKAVPDKSTCKVCHGVKFTCMGCH